MSNGLITPEGRCPGEEEIGPKVVSQNSKDRKLPRLPGAEYFFSNFPRQAVLTYSPQTVRNIEGRLMESGEDYFNVGKKPAESRYLPSFRQRCVQALGVAAITLASFIPLSAFLDRKNVQASEPRFSDPSPQKLLEAKEGMPSEKVLTEKATVDKDAYGPKMTEAELRVANLKITARDYVYDRATGNVVEQWVVLDNRILYRSPRDPVKGIFPDFYPVYQFPAGINISSLASSSNGKIAIAAGVEGHPSYGNFRVFMSGNDKRTGWRGITVPPGFTGSPAELTRFDDYNYWFSILESEGVNNQGIIKVDSSAANAVIQPASIETVMPVNMAVGRLQNTNITSLDSPNRTATMISNRYLEDGLAVSTMNYDTGIGSARIITQTLINGNIINLGYVYGLGIYTDTLGNLKVSTSNLDRNTLYDFNLNNPLDGTATQLRYYDLCDNKNLYDYLNGWGNLTILSLDVSIDAQGNKKTKYGGTRSALSDGNDRAIAGVLEDGICLDLEPYKQSGIMRQQDMQRMKINNQWGYEVGIRYLGKAFIDDNLSAHFTDRGLGSPFIPYPYGVYLPDFKRN